MSTTTTRRRPVTRHFQLAERGTTVRCAVLGGVADRLAADVF